MKVRLYIFIILSFSMYHSFAQTGNTSLWYRQPAAKWTEALPIGNGRLAAMIFGKTNREQIQLNEETIWAGSKVNDINPSAKSHLKEIQSLLLEGKNKEAYTLTKAHLLGTPPEIRSYQTLGDIFIDWQDTSGIVSDYTRSLDLATAIHTTSYKRHGSTYELQSFISAEADLMVVRIRSTGVNLHFRISMAREKDAEVSVMHNRIILCGQIMDEGNPEKYGPEGAHLRFASVTEVENKGGKLSANGNSLEISGSSEVIIRFTAASDYDHAKLDFNRSIDPLQICKSILEKKAAKDYATLEKEHLAEYQPLFNNCTLELPGEDKSIMPTDLRLQQVKSGAKDPGLMALYFQYGRYLLLGQFTLSGKTACEPPGKMEQSF